ncbi:PA0069 family radical SAM protein [Rhodobacteraceae bacterium RKSG542]|uniref:PA0069 family radical SAM protein n=1 Tax=Pseudovibrio flavus TaxID=2529854 RepID=UPI0012BCFFE7|nr:PA0069 family radical SAM protein [Pseudovibrio flavus]MTI18686.1 PA0069 family radical SAM protein [Pseudovibrio flavus]
MGITPQISKQQAGAGAALPTNLHRGRGSATNPKGRFEKEEAVPFDDGWETLEDVAPLKTRVQVEKARSVITRNTSPDIPFDRSINPYRGCEHGCTYCFARPSHTYVGLSAGLDFETNLFAKENCGEVLERELSSPSYKARPIAIGTNTDPYQPIERTHKNMREILEVLERCSHPVTIVTKSALVQRDIDILEKMAQKNLVKVALSITSLDHKLSRSMEPRASSPARRLGAIKALSDAGIPTSVMVAPVVPGLTDHELEAILEEAQAAGAQEANYILLRLPMEVSELFKDWLLREVPGRYRHVLSLIRSMRSGKDYDAEWGKRMRGEGPYADQLSKRFQLACKRLGLKARSSKLDCEQFQRPSKGGVQLSLF